MSTPCPPAPDAPPGLAAAPRLQLPGASLHETGRIAWRSMGVSNKPNGPRTTVDKADFEAFATSRKVSPGLATALAHTPLAALRPVTAARPGHEPVPDRGSPMAPGHALAYDERDRSVARLHRFMSEDVSVAGGRILLRGCAAIVVTAHGLRPSFLPDPDLRAGLAVPASSAAEALALLAGRAPTRDERKSIALARDAGWDESPLARESVNLLARQACATMRRLAALRLPDPDERTALRAALAGAEGPWRMRGWIGGIDPDEGEALVATLRALVAGLPPRTTAPEGMAAGLAGVVAGAGNALVPFLRRGSEPPPGDVEALAAL
jgi:hypothetical protein